MKNSKFGIINVLIIPLLLSILIVSFAFNDAVSALWSGLSLMTWCEYLFKNKYINKTNKSQIVLNVSLINALILILGVMFILLDKIGILKLNITVVICIIITYFITGQWDIVNKGRAKNEKT